MQHHSCVHSERGQAPGDEAHSNTPQPITLFRADLPHEVRAFWELVAHMSDGNTRLAEVARRTLSAMGYRIELHPTRWGRQPVSGEGVGR
jgi:hypothetical protein